MLLFIAAAVVILQLIAAAPHDSAAILNLSSQLPGAEQASEIIGLALKFLAIVPENENI